MPHPVVVVVVVVAASAAASAGMQGKARRGKASLLP